MKLSKLIIASMFILVLGVSAAHAGGDAAAGETKSAACAGCHGVDGMGNADNPPAAGLDEAYFVEQLASYKSGEREHEMMQMFTSQLSEQDMADMAAYYATLGSE